MARLIVLVILLLVASVIAKGALEMAHGLRSRRASRGLPKPGGYRWERRTEQVSRRVKAVSSPGEDREGILQFFETRSRVEAYVEPRTLMNPLSVVLVAEDGEWTRFELRDDAFIRELAAKRGLRVHDASKTGYPERMRRYRRERGGDAGGS